MSAGAMVASAVTREYRNHWRQFDPRPAGKRPAGCGAEFVESDGRDPGDADRDRSHVMITVYVWNFRGTSVAWGHASMRVNGGSPPGEVYISWWPQGSGRSPKVPGVDQIYTVTAIRGRTYADDVRDEEQAPDHVIIFSGLDETAIKTWWADFRIALRLSPMPWHLAMERTWSLGLMDGWTPGTSCGSQMMS